MRLAVGYLIFMIVVGATIFVFISFVQIVGYSNGDFFEIRSRFSMLFAAKVFMNWSIQ